MSFVFKNNFSQKLAASLDVLGTSLTLDGGMSELSDSSTEKRAVLTLFDPFDSSIMEIIHCVGFDSNANVLTVERGKEGTAAKSWAADSGCEMRLTAGMLGTTGFMLNNQSLVWGEFAEISKADPADSAEESMIVGTYASGNLAAGEYDAMLAFGNYATVAAQGSAFGVFAEAEKDAVASGCYAFAEATSVSIGVYATSSPQSVAIGSNADSFDNSIHIDGSEYGRVRSAHSVGVGWWSEDGFSTDFSTFIGAMTSTSAIAGTAIGAGARTDGVSGIALGIKAVCSIESGMRTSAIPYLSKNPDQHAYGATLDFTQLPDPIPAAKRSASPVIIATDPIDLTDPAAVSELNLPANSLFFPDRFDLVISEAVTPSGSPQIQIGTGVAAVDTLLAPTAVSATATHQREKLDSHSADGVSTIYVSLTAAATGTLKARIIAHGYVMEV